MEKEYTVIQPQYVRKFQCDGSACNSLCCQNWNITIDEPTLKKYKKLTDRTLRNKILSAVKLDKKTNLHEIILNQENKCPLLCDDNLCSIQYNLGEIYLSNTCSTYPRQLKEINGALVQTLDLSCPIAAKLTLLNKEPIFFEQLHLIYARPIATKINTENFTCSKALTAYFIDIQMFIIAILQNRKFTIEERLMIIGILLDKIDELEATEKIEKIPKLFETYHALIDSNEILNLIHSIQTNVKEKLRQNLTLIDHLCQTALTEQRKKYTDLLINTFDDIDENDICTLYQDNDKLYYEPFMTKHNYLWENYLVNHVFQTLFPFRFRGTLSKNFILFVTEFSINKFLFSAVAAHRKENLTPEDFIDLMVVLSRLGSNTVYLNSLAKHLEAQNKDIFYFLSII